MKKCCVIFSKKENNVTDNISANTCVRHLPKIVFSKKGSRSHSRNTVLRQSKLVMMSPAGEGKQTGFQPNVSDSRVNREYVSLALSAYNNYLKFKCI